MVRITESDHDALARAKTRAEEGAAMQEVADDITGADDASETSEEASDGEFEAGPTVWEAAEDEEIPENHWDYHMRKNMNDGRGDSVARNLAYVPVCNCMPVCQGEDGCRNPYFMWTKKK
ncbi:unnamed product [Ostreococcus tauri]|uniref:Unnamed product n=1 Tax=Ostreococcus tauri TaxID=70448 RepID=Q00ZI6_OSTTA|nr:unnamed product [Ostreococcus tauri]CAL56296.1 unnamed product [Ostreococcus tauri]|eukprot:XP_003081771.1 unnamed product [Ostreococcus tauri]